MPQQSLRGNTLLLCSVISLSVSFLWAQPTDTPAPASAVPLADGRTAAHFEENGLQGSRIYENDRLLETHINLDSLIVGQACSETRLTASHNIAQNLRQHFSWASWRTGPLSSWLCDLTAPVADANETPQSLSLHVEAGDSAHLRAVVRKTSGLMGIWNAHFGRGTELITASPSGDTYNFTRVLNVARGIFLQSSGQPLSSEDGKQTLFEYHSQRIRRVHLPDGRVDSWEDDPFLALGEVRRYDWCNFSQQHRHTNGNWRSQAGKTISHEEREETVSSSLFVAAFFSALDLLQPAVDLVQSAYYGAIAAGQLYQSLFHGDEYTLGMLSNLYRAPYARAFHGDQFFIDEIKTRPQIQKAIESNIRAQREEYFLNNAPTMISNDAREQALAAFRDREITDEELLIELGGAYEPGRIVEQEGGWTDFLARLTMTGETAFDIALGPSAGLVAGRVAARMPVRTASRTVLRNREVMDEALRLRRETFSSAPDTRHLYDPPPSHLTHIAEEGLPEARLTDIISHSGGANGVVFRGTLASGEHVAIKISLGPESTALGEWDNLLTHFRREIDTYQQVQDILPSGYMPRFYGEVNVGGNPAFAMEEVEMVDVFVRPGTTPLSDINRLRTVMTEDTLENIVQEGRQITEWINEAGLGGADLQFGILTRPQIINGVERPTGSLVVIDAGGLGGNSLRTADEIERSLRSNYRYIWNR